MGTFFGCLIIAAAVVVAGHDLGIDLKQIVRELKWNR